MLRLVQMFFSGGLLAYDLRTTTKTTRAYSSKPTSKNYRVADPRL